MQRVKKSILKVALMAMAVVGGLTFGNVTSQASVAPVTCNSKTCNGSETQCLYSAPSETCTVNTSGEAECSSSCTS